MARDLNDTTLIGRLVREVEVKYTNSGTAIANISIANNDTVKKDNQWIDDVSFFDVVVFGSQAENCGKYLKKGSKIAVNGRLKQNRWEKEGNKMSKIEIIAGSIQFLDSVEKSENKQNNNNQQYETWPTVNDADIPF